MEAITEFSILETVRDSAKFADKIDQLLKAKKEAEAAQKAATDAATDYAKKKVEIDNYVNGKKAELSAKQLEHDKAAQEAAARIEVGKNQVAEALRLRAETNAKESELDGRERALAQREKLLKETLDSIGTRQQALDKATDLIRRQQAHIAAMPKT